MRSAVGVAVVILATATSLRSWRTDRRPKIFGKKISFRSIWPTERRIQTKLVRYHNFFRSRVEPEASNMLAMSWSREAARDAQRWADACRLLTHDGDEGRTVSNYGPCGQNIFVSTHKVPWYFAIKTWWLEKDNFTYGGVNDLFTVGHYTQMVWHSSHKIGCGIAFCSKAKPIPYYNYVCNYCPIGNFLHSLSRPYKEGRPCSACKGHCKVKKLCTNSCPYGDLWINCKELDFAFHHWLCSTRTREGQDRLRHCRATCHCKGKITFP